jgi:hypothetical protein
MKRNLWLAAALILAVGLPSGSARADDLWHFLFGRQDPRLTATGIVVGTAGTYGAYALAHKHGVPATRVASPTIAVAVTTYGCAVVYPIAATIVMQRALTPREAYMGMADCVIPFVGGWIVDQTLPHTAWYDGVPERPHWHHHHHPQS